MRETKPPLFHHQGRWLQDSLWLYRTGYSSLHWLGSPPHPLSQWINNLLNLMKGPIQTFTNSTVIRWGFKNTCYSKLLLKVYIGNCFCLVTWRVGLAGKKGQVWNTWWFYQEEKKGGTPTKPWIHPRVKGAPNRSMGFSHNFDKW